MIALISCKDAFNRGVWWLTLNWVPKNMYWVSCPYYLIFFKILFFIFVTAAGSWFLGIGFGCDGWGASLQLEHMGLVMVVASSWALEKRGLSGQRAKMPCGLWDLPKKYSTSWKVVKKGLNKWRRSHVHVSDGNLPKLIRFSTISVRIATGFFFFFCRNWQTDQM